MAKYIIPESDRTQVQSNDSRPISHEFGYEDDSEFIFNESTIQYFDFDYDAIFQELFTKTLVEYLDNLGKKARIKAELYISDYAGDIKNVDYRLLGLKKEVVEENGEDSQINYYAEYDEDTKIYSNKVIQEDITRTRDSAGYIQKRTKSIKWIKDDETESEPKIVNKHYSITQASRLGEKKRSNLITKLKTDTIGLLIQTGEATTVAEAEAVGMPFLSENCQNIFKYISADTQPLIDNVTNDATYARLDNDIGEGTTIKQYLLSIIDY